MRRDDLVCANCSGLVSEGRCAVCRASRDQYGRGRGGLYAPLWLVLAVLAALVCVLVVEAHYA